MRSDRHDGHFFRPEFALSQSLINLKQIIDVECTSYSHGYQDAEG